MGLPQIVALLLRLLGVTQTIEAFLAGINLAIRGWETEWRALVKPITDTYDIVNNVSHGNVAIKSAIDSMTGSGSYDLNAILAAIAALPAGSSLPSSSVNAADVWAYLADGETQTMSVHQTRAGHLARNMSLLAQLPGAATGAFLIGGGWSTGDWTYEVIDYPNPDWSDLRVGDTRQSWLIRTDTLNDWTGSPYVGEPWALVHFSGPTQSFAWRCNFSEAQFQGWIAALHPTGAGAPIWPGDDLVVKGTPVPITESTIIAGPMDGILITLDTAEPRAGQWVVPPFTSWRYAGYVVFLSAEGHADTTQFLGPDDNVFCPKGMAHADSCVVYLNKIATATVTPWTLA